MPKPYTSGVTFTFQVNNEGEPVAFTEITRVTANQSKSNRPRISIAHLGDPMTMQIGTAIIRVEEPYTNVWQNSGGSNSLDVEYIGSGSVSGGSSGTLDISGPFSFNVTNATVSSCVASGSVGDLVRRTIQVVW